MPAELKDRPIWVLSLPWYAMFTTTVPPCHKEKWEKWYLLSFGTSIAWIGVISHFMVEWCARIGCLLEIPPVVMGTTVLAAGTSIPDALSSISVAKDGYADMAVANAVGRTSSTSGSDSVFRGSAISLGRNRRTFWSTRMNSCRRRSSSSGCSSFTSFPLAAISLD